MKLAISKIFPFVGILLAFSFGSCNDDTDHITDEWEYSDRLPDSLSENSNSEANTNVEDRRIRLSDRIRNLETELDREIRELDQKIESASATEKVKWQIRREKLAMEREQLKNDLDNIGTEISNDWKQLEKDIADRLDRISQDLRDDN